MIWVEENDEGMLREMPERKAFPTGTHVDEIMMIARQVVFDLDLFSLGDNQDSDYGRIAVSTYRYPPGSRLPWHFDGSYLGGFAMYVSGEWNEDWGGYFAFQDNSQAHSKLGIGTFVQPRNNRLIVFKSGIRHSILSIANDARKSRIGLAGFFLTREQAKAFVVTREQGLARWRK